MKIFPKKPKIFLFSFIIILGISIFLILNMCSCNMFKGYRPDNATEEFAEGMIEHYTGVDLDLSPRSREK